MPPIPWLNIAIAPGPCSAAMRELFGHVRGAFTGAVRDRIGRFEAAAGGTLFLDEVGDLPLDLQVKLLRVLQERTFERVGESRTRSSDARVVAASNVGLKRAVLDGRFRDDLFYRLRVVPIEMPPLRSRREDIESLARHLLGRIGARQRRALRFSPDALRVMLRYAWPGNVRELENAIEYAVVVCKGQTIHPEDLPAELASDPVGRAAGVMLEAGGVTSGVTAPAAPGAPRAQARGAPEAAEVEQLRRVLETHRWRRADAARALGISRSTLWRRMREAGLAG